VLCCAVLCCAVLCCAVLCCAVLCCAVLSPRRLSKGVSVVLVGEAPCCQSPEGRLVKFGIRQPQFPLHHKMEGAYPQHHGQSPPRNTSQLDVVMVSLAKTKEPPHNVLYRRLGHIGEEMLKKITQDKEIKKCAYLETKRKR